MKLSILIPTMESRADKLKRLLDILEPQKTDDVEIIVMHDDPNRSMRMSVGEKRMWLLGSAPSEYVAFVDDDDTVSDNYVELILKALEQKPDVCAIRGIVESVNGIKRNFVLSKQYDKIFSLKSDDYQDNTYYRYVSHLNPIRKEIAMQAGFPYQNRFEDNWYSLKLKPLLANSREVLIPETIYHYYFRVAL